MSIQMLSNITAEIIQGTRDAITEAEACDLAALPAEATLDLLVAAHKVREAFKRREVFTCAIVNAKSGYCSQDCAFCAQSGHHQTGVETYPMLTAAELIERARRMQEAGATNFSMVTSGFMLSEQDMDTVCRVANTVSRDTGLNVCASLGDLTEAMAARLRQSGVTNYHHNLETARSYFDQVCTTHDYEEDIETLRVAKAAGLRVCSGGILGLGESWEQRVELAFTLKEADVDSVPLNFLNPIPGTPMQDRTLLAPMEALKTIALYRLIHPARDITICGGREVTLKDYQSWVFAAGANGLMVGNYLTTAGRNIEADMQMIREMGLTPCQKTTTA